MNVSRRFRHLPYQQHIAAAVGEGDDQVHDDKHQVVMPAGGFFAPEAGMPREDFLPDRAERDEDESEAASWVRTPKATPRPPASSATPRKMVKDLDMPMLWARAAGSLRWL